MKTSRFKSPTLIHVIFLSNIILILALFIAITNRDFPQVGDDYRIHIPRMLDTHLHNLVNGPTVQWYTPSFGGGLPAYPNPQSVQYSLPQFLLFAFDPWVALMISIAAYALIGVASFYIFLKETLTLSAMAAALGAIFIIVNGFYIEHIIAGHVGFQQFPLLALILAAIFTKRMNFLQSGTVLGITLALIINQAGFYLLVIFGLSLAICLPLLYILRPLIFEGLDYARVLASGFTIGLLLSISKLSAIYFFMRFFPRELSDNYGLTYIQGIKGMIVQLIGYTTLAPIYLVRSLDINKISDLLQVSTGAQYGIWETDISLSPGMLLLLFICLMYFSRRVIKVKEIIATKGARIAILITVLSIWLTIDLTLAQGPLYEFVKTLPILRSLHVNVRFTSAFILPASLLAVYGFDFLSRQHPRKAFILFLTVNALTVAAITPYYLLSTQNHARYFNLVSSLETFNKIKEGREFLIKRVLDVSDQSVFSHNASNLGQTYEPIFGYRLEYFHPELQEGSIFQVDNGYYNMTNPASYVFPEENNLVPFERFHTDQLVELEKFANREQPDFKISVIQNISNILNLATLIGVSFYVFTQFGSFMIRIFFERRPRAASI